MDSSEIAKIAHVSRSTVSRVLNHHPGVSQKMRDRVEAVIREYNYVPDAAARKLAGKQNKILGLFIVDTVDTYDENNICTTPFYNDYIAMAIDIANSRDYDLLVRVVRRQDINEIERVFQSGSIAGGIIMGDKLQDDILEKLQYSQHKIVLYNQVETSPSDNIVIVNYNNFKCGKMAGEVLTQFGHRRIAVVTGEKNKICAMERLAGLKAALQNVGCEFDEEHYLEHAEFHRESGGYEATQKLLRKNSSRLPTALCAGSGPMMMGAIHAISDMGLRIPEDISVIGIDGIDIAKYTTPPMTEVAISRKRVASVTITNLIQFIENGKADVREFEISDAELRIRNSVKIFLENS